MADSSTTVPDLLTTDSAPAQPRVLLLGWEYAPRLTGGLGTASVRLAHALASKVELSVIVPRLPEADEADDGATEPPLSELVAATDGPDELRSFPASIEWPDQPLVARPQPRLPSTDGKTAQRESSLSVAAPPTMVSRLQVLSELTAAQVHAATAPRRPPRYEVFAKQVLHVALGVASPYVDGPAEERVTTTEEPEVREVAPEALQIVDEKTVFGTRQHVVVVTEEVPVAVEMPARQPEALPEPETVETATLEVGETAVLEKAETATLEEAEELLAAVGSEKEVLAEEVHASAVPKPAAAEGLQTEVRSAFDPVAEALAPFRNPALNPLTLPSTNAEVVQFARLAARLASGEAVDVVYAHDWPTFLAGVEIRLEKRVPLVLHVHSTSYDRHGPRPNGWVFELERAAFRAADRIVAVSSYGAQVLAEQYNVDPKRIRVVHHGLAAGPLGPQWEARPVVEAPLVLFIGRLTAQKNPLGFVEIARRVAAEVPQARFAIAGDGPLREKIRQAAAEAGFDEQHFKLLGFLDDDAVTAKLAEAAVVCLPARSEPFGLAALEAAAAGVPLVLSTTTGAAEVLPGALTADYDDAAGLAGHVTHLLRDEPARRRAVRENAAAARRLTWERAAEEVFEILCEVQIG